MDLQGKVAIVTGAGRGLGWAIAERLSRDGAKLVIAEIDWPSAEEKAKAIKEANREVFAVRTDVSRLPEVEEMVRGAMAKFGRIDILVNNAGVLGPYFTVEEYPEEIWDRVIAVNLKGTFLCCKAVLPVMRKQGSGSIINIASVAGKEGNASMAPYSASKGAIITLTKTLGKELATSGIRVNCVSPALLETDMAKAMTPEQRALLTSKIPIVGKRSIPSAEIRAEISLSTSPMILTPIRSPGPNR